MAWRPWSPPPRSARPSPPAPPFLVAGAARAGFAAARLLAERHGPAAVRVWERVPRDSLVPRLAELEDAGIELILGGDGEAALSAAGPVRTLVKSPGIRPGAPLLAHARTAGIEVMDEAELAWRLDERPWIGVTGTNGKGTVAALVTAILEAAGARPLLAGNTHFGPPLSASLGEDADIVVAELSSFQLAGCPELLAEVAVLTNLGFEHWAHHGGRAAYVEAKRSLFIRPGGTVPVAVLDPSQAPEGMAAELTSRGAAVTSFGPRPGADLRLAGCSWTLGAGRMTVDTATGIEEVELSMPGRHNAMNALAALALARALGLDPDCARGAVSSCKAPPGRFERVPAAAPFDLVVDFAHNPAGVESAFATARGAEGVAGRLIALGSTLTSYAPEEQAAMGAALAQADELVLTTLRWSTDQPDEVPAALAAGARSAGAAPRLVPDRDEAIEAAIALAGPGDVVLLTGRGALAASLYGRGDRELSRPEAESAVRAAERMAAA